MLRSIELSWLMLPCSYYGFSSLNAERPRDSGGSASIGIIFLRFKHQNSRESSQRTHNFIDESWVPKLKGETFEITTQFYGSSPPPTLVDILWVLMPI